MMIRSHSVEGQASRINERYLSILLNKFSFDIIRLDGWRNKKAYC
jgi:hypothetical protein